MPKDSSEKKNRVSVIRHADGTFQFNGRSFDIVRDRNRALEPFGYELRVYALKLMLLPTDGQCSQINSTIGCTRLVHNHYITCRQAAYQGGGPPIDIGRYKKEFLPAFREEKPFIKDVDQKAVRKGADHADRAFQNFFAKKAGFPRFASKRRPNGNRYSTDIKTSAFFEKDGVIYVKLPKIGAVQAVPPEGKVFKDLCPSGVIITGVTVCREVNGYYASLHMSLPVPKKPPVQEIDESRICAVDMGLKSYAVTRIGPGSPTEKAENPRWIRKNARKIRRLQRALSRKEKGSKNYEKCRLKLAKAHKKIADQRNDFQHKLSRRLVNSSDAFICEKLNIAGMLKNHKLAREISSAAWGSFLGKVEYKMKWKGGVFLKVDPFFPSSKLCHCCGYKYEKLSLREREWTCPNCGRHHDRDGNAVRNIMAEGIRILQEQGITVRMKSAA